MSGTIQRSSFQSALLPIINKWEGDEMAKHDPLYSKICEVVKSDSAHEVDGVLAGFATLQRKAEGSALNFDTSKQVYTPRYTHLTYALGFRITMEMRQDGKELANAQRFTRMLSRSAAESKDILAANVYNNGYTSGYTMDGGDGVILFSASHPTVYGNQSNTISSNADLSEASIESLYFQIRQARDDRGLFVNLKPRKILVNVTQEADLSRILNSNLRVATADNDLNFAKESNLFPEGIVASPHISDTDAFYILTDVMDGIKFFDRADLPIDSDNEFDTKNASYSKIIRCSQGWTNWRGAYASPGV